MTATDRMTTDDKAMRKLRRWLAGKLSPEMAFAERRLFRLRNELASDRHWLGYDFPEVDVFAFRALVMDANYARKLDEKPLDMTAGGIRWSDDIAQFREQMRTEFRAALADGGRDG